jgi:hypothetical protein
MMARQYTVRITDEEQNVLHAHVSRWSDGAEAGSTAADMIVAAVEQTLGYVREKFGVPAKATPRAQSTELEDASRRLADLCRSGDFYKDHDASMELVGAVDKALGGSSNSGRKQGAYDVVDTREIERSSNVREISYTAGGDMIVQFKGGDEYLYEGVPRQIYDDMAKAESVGKFLGEIVKGKYKYRKLEDDGGS